MANKRDYYEVLGIDRNADENEIKQAFRKLAKEYHPDVSSDPNAEEKFKEINEAYQVLSNSQRKTKYDQFGHQGIDFEQQGGSDFNFSDIFSSFSDFFGGFDKPKDEQHHQKQDWELGINLTFFEAMHGVTKTIKLKSEELCSQCNGSGAQTRNDVIICHSCNGAGFEVVKRQTIFGLIQQKQLCPYCQGLGKTIKNKCSVCRGKKKLKKEQEVKVFIPKGVSSGQQIKLTGKGGINVVNKQKGDLYFEFNVATNPVFKRQENENDFLTDVPVSYLDALLGKEIQVPTIDGIKMIDLEPNTKNKKIIRLKNYGAYNPNNPKKRGHQYLQIKIQYPDQISKTEKELLKKIVEETNFHPNQEFITNLEKRGLIFNKK